MIRNKSGKKKMKTTYKKGDVIPEYMNPKVVIERLIFDDKVVSDSVEFDDVKSLLDINNDDTIKAIVDPKSKKSIISKQQCQVGIQPKMIKRRHQDLLELKETFVNQRKRCQVFKDSTSNCENGGKASIKCNICEKGYSTEKKLLNHQENKHMIVYKPNAKPQKRVSFSDHVIVHKYHKSRKRYTCIYCDKSFIDRTFFKVHIKLHCDMCTILQPNKLKYTEHKRNVCRILKIHKCKHCDDIYFKLMDLKDHSYIHILQCYVCDVCKDQFKTKCAIAHHISFLHSNERPTSLYEMLNLGNERLYLCNYCDESSVERDVIESHVQLLPDLANKAITGYEDYFFCDQCMKKFDTETDMLQHKLTHFLKTSDNSQIRNKSGKKKMKTTYRKGDVIPEYMNPKVVIERLIFDDKVITDS